MTIVLPVWMEIILRPIWFLFLITFYYKIVTKIFKWLKFKHNKWVIGAIVFIALISTQNFIIKQYKMFIPHEGDIVVKGNGEIIENATDKIIWTTDENLFVFIGSHLPSEHSVTYPFMTKDGEKQHIELSINFHETDIETLRYAFQIYKEVGEPIDEKLVKFFSSTIYFDEALEERLKKEIGQQISDATKEELTKERLEEMITMFETHNLHEFERNWFSIQLSEY